MIIPIDSKHRLVGAENSWNLEVLQIPKKEGKEPYWKPIKYYGTMRVAFQEACARDIRLAKADGLVEAFAAAQRVSDKYSRLFDGLDVTDGQRQARE